MVFGEHCVHIFLHNLLCSLRVKLMALQSKQTANSTVNSPELGHYLSYCTKQHKMVVIAQCLNVWF